MPTDSIPFRTKVTLPDGRTLPIGKLLCIGRNYAEHASEMKSDVPDEPMVFLKPASAVVRDGESVVLPPQSEDVHHEVELVAVIGRGGREIPEADALDHVAAYAVGLIGMIGVKVLAPAFYARQDTRTPFRAAAWATGTQIVRFSKGANEMIERDRGGRDLRTRERGRRG